MTYLQTIFWGIALYVLIGSFNTINANEDVDVRFSDRTHANSPTTIFKGTYRNCTGETQTLNLTKEISTSIKVVIGNSLKGSVGVTIPFGKFADLNIGAEVESAYQRTFGRSSVTIANAEQLIEPYTIATYNFTAEERWNKGRVRIVDRGFFRNTSDEHTVWRLSSINLNVNINGDRDACFETRVIPFRKEFSWNKGFESRGTDCEMSTNKGDVIRAEFRSVLGKEFSPLPAPPGSTYVSYYFWVREGKGDKPGNTIMVVDKLERLDITGGGWEINKFLDETEVSTDKFTLFTGGNHKLVPINHPAVQNSYWDSVMVKVDHDGGNDCRNARIELVLNTNVEIINRTRIR